MLQERSPVLPLSLRLIAFVSAACLVVLISCSGGFKSVKGEDEVFSDPRFWERAEAMFGEFGGGLWLKEKATTVRYEGGNWYVTEDHHYQLVVIDAEMMKDYADVSIPFGPISRIVRLQARTIESTGEVILVKPENMYERSRIPEFMLYADTKSKVFAMPGFSDGCIIDVDFRIENQALYFLDDFEFSSVLPVRKARYSYSLPERISMAGYRVHYISHNVEAPPKEQSQVAHFGEMVTWTWELDNIRAYPPEPWSPPRERFIPRVVLSGVAPGEQSDDWGNFTKWYARRIDWLDEPMPKISQVANGIAEDAVGAADVVQRIADYVGENIRYVSVAIKDSGFDPHEPIEVLENRHGDCKDMSCTLVAMLRAESIDAYPALLLTRDMGTIDKSLVVPRFNHMIVYVSTAEGDLWVDPTAGPCTVGYLPPADRDVDALVIKGKQPAWLRTPSSVPLGSARRAVTSARVDDAGMIHGETSVTFTGDLGFELRNRFAGKRASELIRAVEAEIGSYFADVTLDSCRILGHAGDLPEMTLTGKFEKPAAATRIEDRLVVRLDFLRSRASRLAGIPKGSGRTYPLWLISGWVEADTINIEIPPGWRVEKLPGEWSESCRQGFCSIDCFEHGGTVTLVVEHSLAAGEVHTTEFEDFLAFCAEARERLSQGIILRKL